LTIILAWPNVSFILKQDSHLPPFSGNPPLTAEEMNMMNRRWLALIMVLAGFVGLPRMIPTIGFVMSQMRGMARFMFEEVVREISTPRTVAIIDREPLIIETADECAAARCTTSCPWDPQSVFFWDADARAVIVLYNIVFVEEGEVVGGRFVADLYRHEVPPLFVPSPPVSREGLEDGPFRYVATIPLADLGSTIEGEDPWMFRMEPLTDAGL